LHSRGREYYFTGFRQMGMIHVPDGVYNAKEEKEERTRPHVRP
jgi:hypothetical protein